ncbi:hypothetical protein HK101_001816 [Irineochytrium annulatum]|nr:hypothetical protein HK101_001816 [Irineochytrium annulatum]
MEVSLILIFALAVALTSLPFPPQTSPSLKLGDWLCTYCSFHNYANRRSCLKCSTPHPSDAILMTHVAFHSALSGPPPPPAIAPTHGHPLPSLKPGDWLCPNRACMFQNFASRRECMRCKGPKPLEVHQQHHHHRALPNAPNAASSPVRSGVSLRLRPGDWICGTCDLNNFSSRTRCMRCGRDAAECAVASVPGTVTTAMVTPRARPTDRPGDWLCGRAECRYHNYASRVVCYRCGARKEDKQGEEEKEATVGDEFEARSGGEWGRDGGDDGDVERGVWDGHEGYERGRDRGYAAMEERMAPGDRYSGRDRVLGHGDHGYGQAAYLREALHYSASGAGGSSYFTG